MAQTMQQTATGNPRVDNSNPAGGPFNSLTSLTLGSVALSQHVLNEMMEEYRKIIKEMEEQKVASTKAVGQSVRNQAQSMRAGGQALKDAVIKAAILTGVAGGLSLAIGIGMPALASLRAPTGDLENEIGNMNTVEKAMKAPRTGGSVAGTKDAENGNTEETELSKIATQFKEHNYDEARLKSDRKEDPKMLKALKNKLGIRQSKHTFEETEHSRLDTEKAVHQLQAVRDRGEFDYSEWNKEFAKRKDTLVHDLSTKQQKINTSSQLANTISSFVSNGGQQVASAYNAGGQATKAINDGDATVAGGTGRLAEEVAGTYGQAMAKAYDSQNGVVQIRERLQQTQVAR